MIKDPSNKDYWNRRVLDNLSDLERMIFIDPRFKAYEKKTRQILSAYKDLSVLDVCCGYGRFSDIFNNYLGIDFSDEMIKLAKQKFPSKEFKVADIKNFEPEKKYDVIIEVNSLHSLGMSPEAFIDKFSKKAKVAVCCLEADRFIIHPVYG